MMMMTEMPRLIQIPSFGMRMRMPLLESDGPPFFSYRLIGRFMWEEAKVFFLSFKVQLISRVMMIASSIVSSSGTLALIVH